jgi:hypothetical protein
MTGSIASGAGRIASVVAISAQSRGGEVNSDAH